MCLKIDVFVIAVIFVKISCICQLLGPSYVNARSYCDHTTNIIRPEQNYVQSSKLNWLGVLKVQLHNGETPFMAFTGIVLIKVNYALSNADIIGRIPIYMFKEKAEAVFVLKHNKPWSCSVTEYYTHPEYEIGVKNTLAILNLDVGYTYNYLLKPICFPKDYFTTPKSIYAAGFMDYNKPDKVIFKMKYLNQSNCKEFYGDSGLVEGFASPRNYYCVYAPGNDTQCIWENGMALISNVSGWFELIGLSVKGSGYAAPSRFIAIEMYKHWIRSVTGPDETNKVPEFLKSTRKEVTEKSTMAPEVTKATIQILKITEKSSIAEEKNIQEVIKDTRKSLIEEETGTVAEVNEDTTKSLVFSEKNGTIPEVTEDATKFLVLSEETATVPKMIEDATKSIVVSEETGTVAEVNEDATKSIVVSEENGTVAEVNEDATKSIVVSKETGTVVEVNEDATKSLVLFEKTSTIQEVIEDATKSLVISEETGSVPEVNEETTKSLVLSEKYGTVLEVTTVNINTKTFTEVKKVTERTNKVTETPQVTPEVTKTTRKVLEVTKETRAVPDDIKVTAKMQKNIKETNKVGTVTKASKVKLKARRKTSKVAKHNKKVLKDSVGTGTVTKNVNTNRKLKKTIKHKKTSEVPEVPEDDDDDIPLHLFLDEAAAPQRVLIPEVETRHNLLHFRVSRNTSADGSRRYIVVPSHKPKDACENVNLLHSEVYELNFDIENTGDNGVSTYKLTMNDLLQSFNRCVVIKVRPIPPAKVALEFNELLDETNETKTTESNTTNKSSIKYLPLDNFNYSRNPTNVHKREIPANSNEVPNYDLYITFYYIGFVQVEFQMYSAVESEEYEGTDETVNNSKENDEQFDVNNNRRNHIDSREYFEGLTKKPEVKNDPPFWGLRKPRNYL